MKKRIIDILIAIVTVIITCVVMFFILREVEAAEKNKTWNLRDAKVERIQDGNVVCYVATASQATSEFMFKGTHVSIICVKVK